MTQRRYRILLTSAGTSTALGVIKGLASAPHFEVHTADINPLNMLAVGAFATASHSTGPLASQRAEYIDFISGLVAEKSIDFIYPIHDEEIRALASADAVALITKLPQSLVSKVDVCTDKLEMARMCASNGIPSPATFSCQEFAASGFFPAFSKPRRGVGSANVNLVLDESGLKTVPSQTVELVFQEVCEKPEVTVDVLSAHDEIVTVARERIETKAGVSTKCRVWHSFELETLAKEIVRVFGLQGLFCFQVMKRDGRWVVTDINPRPGGATAMTLAVGINLYREYFEIQMSGFDLGRFSALRDRVLVMRESVVTRYYQEHVSQG